MQKYLNTKSKFPVVLTRLRMTRVLIQLLVSKDFFPASREAHRHFDGCMFKLFTSIDLIFVLWHQPEATRTMGR